MIAAATAAYRRELSELVGAGGKGSGIWQVTAGLAVDGMRMQSGPPVARSPLHPGPGPIPVAPVPLLRRITRAAGRGINRAGQRAGAGIADGRLRADGGGDGGGELPAVGGVGDQVAFRGIAEVASL